MEYYYNKSQGRCVQCGMELRPDELKKGVVRCRSCRQRIREEREIEARAAKERKLSAWEEKLHRCSECNWSVNCGGVLYCPSAHGTCLKEDMKHDSDESGDCAAGDGVSDCVEGGLNDEG